jgi:hypothetical protein
VELPPDIGGNRRPGTGGINQKEFARLVKRNQQAGCLRAVCWNRSGETDHHLSGSAHWPVVRKSKFIWDRPR